MKDFRNQWSLDMALEVIKSTSIDSKTWSDAVKWLLLYGPVEIRQMLCQASSIATAQYFPQLKPTGFTDKGEPCYDVKALAKSLGISEDDIREMLSITEQDQEEQFLFNPHDTHDIQ